MLVYAATTNAGKLRELTALFAGTGWEIELYAGYREPVEGESSYAENAALKARALRAQLVRAGRADAAALGDDSGIEVTALDGRPGVLSARYGGEGADWPARRRLLVAELDATGSADRSARFVCALHFIAADGSEYAIRRDVEGKIVTQERGLAGFSYDPVFEYPPLGKTFAELSEEEKNAHSHRGRACRELYAAVAARAEGEESGSENRSTGKIRSSGM
jgi:XTP/dITP diphosphohydrolase